MSAELILAVFGVLEGCIKLARLAISTCQAFRTAEKDIDDKVVMLETIWMKLETQLNVLGKIKDHLSDELAQCHFNLLQKLESTLLQAVTQLERAAKYLDPTGKVAKVFQVGRWKYALVKKSLDSLMKDLEAWQARFDISWYLIIRISGSVLDPALAEVRRQRPEPAQQSRKVLSPLDNMLGLRQAIEDESNGALEDQKSVSILFDDTQLLNAHENAILYSTASTMRLSHSDASKENKVLVIETIDISAGVNPQNTTDAEHLCRKLQNVDPDTFGLLRCEGLIKKTDTSFARRGVVTSLEIVYRAPSFRANPDTTTTIQPPPTTLRQLLIDERDASLTAILKLAKQLVRSVSFVHACDLVHKNIRPENILVFPSPEQGQCVTPPQLAMGESYLIGFSQFRNINLETNRLGDTAWHRNLYRHPTRQGICILERYVMQHDIYSLGVCLLEIGLWRSLVGYYPETQQQQQDSDQHHSRVNEEIRQPVLAPSPGFALELRKVLTDKDFEKTFRPDATTWIKDDLVLLARKRLPQRMGDLYTEVVVECLTCLDSDSDSFGSWGERSLPENDSVIAVGVRFVERILGRMGEISV
ncbi:hypothetical protein QBC35DRAFT_114760 [Podospora australis]|uniref:Protein kinase domain-containing protein n=1 Tax=Podospora australis TaxID=1536484 RepID=A0AAN7AEW9_9PEZI|nr:hypothetical protein QBC35DRAFT_114760 [Podospora australis]